MKAFGDVYGSRRVLLTGHTGFKGSWLALWLKELGAHVYGVALPPASVPNHWDMLQLDLKAHCQDLRDAAAMAQLVGTCAPEIVFHLAAQPLVRRSYRDPLETWSTNVMGTANLLEACRHTPSVGAIVVVTSDKCYENRSLCRGFRETDTLGGHDPYSASKAATELVTASYRQSFFDSGTGPLIATGRAGNVIGGGDWSEDRLIPDLVRAIASGQEIEIRSPNATRPWQHVLDSLSGYLLLGQKLLGGERDCARAWNFGPASAQAKPVAHILARMAEFWPELVWRQGREPKLHEADELSLDSTQARTHLGWNPVWCLEQALRATSDWYRAYLDKGLPVSRRQLLEYVADARQAGIGWSLA